MRPSILRAMLVGTFLAGSIGVVAIAAQTGTPAARPAAASHEHAFIDMRAPKASRDPLAAALLRKARAQGQVRVIVGLGIELHADHTLTPAQSAAQMAQLHAEQQAVAARAGVAPQDVTQFNYIPFVSLWVNATQLGRLLADTSIVNIQEDAPGTAGLNKSAPFIKADKVWEQKFKGNGFTIAILDTGIDKTHPMFANKIVAEACYSTNNAAQGVHSLCPRRASQSTAVGSGVNCPASLDPCWHGTHIGGIAGGRPVKESAGTTLIGIAPNVRLISIKVFSAQGSAAIVYDTDWIRGLEQVYALHKSYPIAAVNMSFGSGKYTGPCDTQNAAATKIIRQLRTVRIATIVASMNDGYDNATEEPACISEAIAVGATLHTSNKLATYSNHAPWVRLLAPGSGIMSAKIGGGFMAGDGTSMAAPHVAGAFALMRDVLGGSTVDDIAAALECSGPLVTRSGLSRPRIDVLAAKTYLLSPPETLLAFTFDSGAPGWVSNSGDWAPFGGYLQISDFNAGYKVASVLTCNEGQDITAQNVFRSTSGSPTDTQGIVFKAEFAADSSQNDTIMSGYVAAYSRSGTAVVRRYDNYDLVHSSGSVTTLCSGTAKFSGSGQETLLMQTRGGVHTFIMNGTKICVARDWTYGTGSAGIFGYLSATNTKDFLAVDGFTVQPVEVVPKKSPETDIVLAAEPQP